MVRKLLCLLTGAVVLSSCGAGGLGDSSKGFYKLDASVVKSTSNTCVINYSLDDSGYLKSYSFTPDNDFLELKISKSYVGQKPDNPLPMYLKDVILRIGNYEEHFTGGGEITEDGITVTIPLTVGAKIFSLLIEGNRFEDQSQNYSGVTPVANKSLFWIPVEKQVSYDGSTGITVAETVPIRNVVVTVDNQTCAVAEDGTIEAPCQGSVDFTSGTINLTGVDSALLEQSHQSTGTYDYRVNGGEAGFILSEKVEPGSVKVSVPSLGLSAVDDGNGNLTGDVTGTVDYTTGRITVSIPKDKLPYQESKVTVNYGYTDSGTLVLPDLKEGTLSLSAVSGDQIVGYCTDNGNGELAGDCTGTVDYTTGKVNYQWNDRVSQYMQNTQVVYRTDSTVTGFQDTGTLKLKTPVKPLSFVMKYVEDGNVKAICSDNGDGTLQGDCTGTIDYSTGDVSYDWTDGISSTSATTKEVDISYEYEDASAVDNKITAEYTKKDYSPVDLTFSWKSLDKNLNVTFSYEKKNTDAPSVFTFTVPPETNVESVVLYDGQNRIPQSDYEISQAGNTVTVQLLNGYFPDSGLTAYWNSVRTFNWNPDITVSSPRDAVSVTGTVEVVAKLSTGDTLTQKIPVTIVGQSCETTEQNQTQ